MLVFLRDAPGSLGDPIDNFFGFIMLLIAVPVFIGTVWYKIVTMKEDRDREKQRRREGR